MINFEMYMIRDKKSGRWHNYGGLTEWMPDSAKGGVLWYDKQGALDFIKKYNDATVEGWSTIEAELVTVEVREKV